MGRKRSASHPSRRAQVGAHLRMTARASPCEPRRMRSARSWQPGTALRQSAYFGPVRPYQRFFLGPAPALDLPLRGNAVGNPIEIFRPDENHRPPGECVAGPGAGIVLVDARREVLPGGASDVEGVVGARKNVDVNAHRNSILRGAPKKARTSG